MNNNDFISRNFTAGNTATGTMQMNIPIRGTQAVDTAGRYISRLTGIRPFSNRAEDGDKVLFQYELVNATGAVHLFRETFTCSPFVDRWNEFGKYITDKHGLEGGNDISTLVGLEEIITLDWSSGYLNIVHREKCPEGFLPEMLDVEEALEQ